MESKRTSSFFLTPYHDKRSAEVLTPIDTTDHSLVSVQIDSKPITSPDLPCSCRVFRYAEADWGTFRSYMTEAPLSTTSNMLPQNWCLNHQRYPFQNGIFYTPISQQKLEQPLFSPECATAIAHGITTSNSIARMMQSGLHFFVNCQKRVLANQNTATRNQSRLGLKINRSDLANSGRQPTRLGLEAKRLYRILCMIPSSYPNRLTKGDLRFYLCFKLNFRQQRASPPRIPKSH